MSLSIVVNGGGTFTASMEEGPVSFTASLGAVPGPTGATGATGPTGVVAATAPILYDSGTQTVSLDPAYNPFDQSLNTTDSVTFDLATVQTLAAEDIALQSGVMTFPDFTVQSTAGVPNPTAAPADGQILAYDEDTSRPVWINNDARSLFVTARNNTGTTIPAGKVVYISGATGNRPTIALAIATSEATSARVIGITSEAIANNSNGSVIVSGIVENIDTSAFSAGDVVYLSDTVAGGLRTTLPTQPLHGVVIGIVTRSNNSVGSIEVTIQNYQELSELSDVLIASKANNDLLAWDSTSSVWKNKTFATLGLLTASTAASTYAPLASPTFTGTVTIPAGASISGFLTEATAASTYAAIASSNTFTAGQVIETTTTSAALRVTQLGTGEAFRVEDSTNPDSSPFVINADGNIGIGRLPTSRKVEVSGNFAITGQTNLSTSSGNVSVLLVESHATNTADCVVITHAGTGASFRVNDESSDTTPFIVDAGGNVGVKTASPSTDFEVNGNAKATTLTIGTSDAISSIAQNATDPGIVATQTYTQEIHINIGGTIYKLPARV